MNGSRDIVNDIVGLRASAWKSAGPGNRRGCGKRQDTLYKEEKIVLVAFGHYRGRSAPVPTQQIFPYTVN